MKKLAFFMAMIMLVAVMAAPAYAAPDPSANRDDQIVEELPDPNDPNSPDEVTIIENGQPVVYVKTDDGYVPADELDIGDGDTPLGELPDVKSPQTGESGVDAVLVMVGALCLAGLAALAVSKRKAEC